MDIPKAPTIMYTARLVKEPYSKVSVQTKLHPSQHKGRRVPLHLLVKVETELIKLTDDELIIRLEKCPDDLFISPVVIKEKQASKKH